MFDSFLEVLRRTIKEHGFTQAALAKKLGVSVPTIKRWLRGEGLDLKALERILAATGLTLAEVALLADLGLAKRFEYSEDQENLLSRDLTALTMFDHLLHGFSVKMAGRLSKLSDLRVSRILKDLEAVGLLERHSGNRIKLLVHGEPSWRKKGPLAHAFKENAVRGLLAQADRTDGAKVLGVYWLMREDIRKAQILLDELREFLRRAESRARVSPEQSRLYGYLSAYCPLDWSVLSSP